MMLRMLLLQRGVLGNKAQAEVSELFSHSVRVQWAAESYKDYRQKIR